MRKLLTALTCLLFMAGLVIAAEVTLVKYDKDKKEVTVKDEKEKEHTNKSNQNTTSITVKKDKKEITVKDGDKEKTYKVSDKTKFSVTDKDGNTKEATYEQAEKRLSNEKQFGKLKLDITTDGDKLTEVKYKGGKGKKQ